MGSGCLWALQFDPRCDSGRGDGVVRRGSSGGQKKSIVAVFCEPVEWEKVKVGNVCVDCCGVGDNYTKLYLDVGWCIDRVFDRSC